MSGSSNAAPALPSRTKATSDEPPVPDAEEEEEFEEVEDYQLPDVSVPKPGMLICIQAHACIFTFFRGSQKIICNFP